MSSRATGRRYGLGGSSGPMPVNRDDSKPSLVDMLLGNSKVSGGPTVGPDGKISATPYTAKGGWGAREARRLNTGLLGPAFQTQTEGEQERLTSAQEAKQKQDLETLKNKLAEHMMQSQQFNAIATKLNIPVSELAGSISTELAANALKQQQNIGAGLDSPEVKAATKNQLVAEANAQDAINRQRLKLDTGMAGVSTIPGANGGPPTTIFGGTPGGQSTTLAGTGFINPKTGQPSAISPITQTQPYTQGRISVPQSTIDAAKGMDNPDASSQLDTGEMGVTLPNRSVAPTIQLNTGITPGGAISTPGMGNSLNGLDPSILFQGINNSNSGAQPTLNTGLGTPNAKEVPQNDGQYTPQNDPQWSGELLKYLQWVLQNGGNFRMGGTNAFNGQ